MHFEVHFNRYTYFMFCQIAQLIDKLLYVYIDVIHIYLKDEITFQYNFVYTSSLNIYILGSIRFKNQRGYISFPSRCTNGLFEIKNLHNSRALNMSTGGHTKRLSWIHLGMVHNLGAILPNYMQYLKYMKQCCITPQKPNGASDITSLWHITQAMLLYE